GLEGSFPNWGRNSDSEINRECYDSFSTNGSGRVGLAHGCRDVHLGEGRRKAYGCDHTSTKAPDPIRTPKLSLLGR
ncbi:unnamed protein product, partial [Musa textilis]